MDFVQFLEILLFGNFFLGMGNFFRTWENQVPLTSLIHTFTYAVLHLTVNTILKSVDF